MESGNIRKLSRLYELYEQPLYRIAYAVLRDEEMAEDAVSAAFETAIRNINRIGSVNATETKSYMIRIIRSAAIDLYRTRAREIKYCKSLSDETENELAVEGSTETLLEERMLMEQILENLNDDERELIRLRCTMGLSWQQTGQRLGLSEAAVRKRFERIRKKLIDTREAWK